jgi:hypothetical protein
MGASCSKLWTELGSQRTDVPQSAKGSPRTLRSEPFVVGRFVQRASLDPRRNFDQRTSLL